MGGFVSLSASESFGVEYWPLELYKLSLAPPEADFSYAVPPPSHVLYARSCAA